MHRALEKYWQSDFIGKSALLELQNHPLDQQMVSIVFADSEANPLGNEPVYVGERVIGKTFSAAYGYRVDAPLALALILSEFITSAELPLVLQIDIAGVRYSGNLIHGSML